MAAVATPCVTLLHEVKSFKIALLSALPANAVISFRGVRAVVRERLDKLGELQYKYDDSPMRSHGDSRNMYHHTALQMGISATGDSQCFTSTTYKDKGEQHMKKIIFTAILLQMMCVTAWATGIVSHKSYVYCSGGSPSVMGGTDMARFLDSHKNSPGINLITPDGFSNSAEANKYMRSLKGRCPKKK